MENSQLPTQKDTALTTDVATGIARILKREGVEWVSTFPVCRVNNALGRENVPMLMMRDDRYAIAVADAFSRITGGKQIGVATVQGGVNAAGLQVAYAGLAQAYEDNSPMLCITDGVPIGSSENSHFDLTASLKSVSKWYGYVDKPERVPEFMRRAFTMLRTGRPGPVILAIPEATGQYDETADPYTPVKGWKALPDPADVRTAVEMLMQAQSPLLYAGEGVIYADAVTELKAFVELANVPVITTLKAKGAFPENHPLFVGGARRSGDRIPQEERPDPRRRLQPVAGPLQSCHPECGEKDHHRLQRQRVGREQNLPGPSRPDRRRPFRPAGAGRGIGVAVRWKGSPAGQRGGGDQGVARQGVGILPGSHGLRRGADQSLPRLQRAHEGSGPAPSRS